MKKNTRFNRRQFLQGCIASSAYASTMSSGLLWSNSAFAADATTKFIFMYSPQGAIPELWHPTATGSNFELPAMSAPLEAVKQHCLFMDKLTLDRPGHGPNYKLMGEHITSIDCVLSQTIGQTTPFASLHLGVLNGSASMSRINRQRLDYESNPINAFQRLFGQPPTSNLHNTQQHSILDLHKSSLTRFAQSVGSSEKIRLESHTDAIRALEKRLDSALEETVGGQCSGGAFNANGFDGDESNGDNFDIIFDLHTDLLVLAMQCGLTRVSSLMLNNTGAEVFIPSIGASSSYHSSIHSGPGRDDKYLKYRHYFSQKSAEFIAKLRDAQDTDGSSLLDNTVLLHVTDTGHGSHHDGDSPPYFLAGGSRLIKTGQAVSLPNANCKDLLDTMAHLAGIDVGHPSYEIHGSGPISSLLS